MSDVRPLLAFSDLDAFAAAAGEVGATVRALHLCPSGSIAVIRLPAGPKALSLAVARLVDAPHDFGVDHIGVAQQLTLWHNIDGAERHVVNAPASAVVAAHGLVDVFGPDGLVWGPVLLTGRPDRRGGVTALGLSAIYAIARSALPARLAAAAPRARIEETGDHRDLQPSRLGLNQQPDPLSTAKGNPMITCPHEGEPEEPGR